MYRFLYMLARDNECKVILETLIGNPTLLLHIAKQSISFRDQDVRWQNTYGFGELEWEYYEVQSLLSQFLCDEYEYVRKRTSYSYNKKGSDMIVKESQNGIT